MNKTGQCLFYGKPCKFVRAHIIPKSFLNIEQGKHLAVFKLRGDHPTKRSQIGIYDDQIIGELAERLFAEIDTYAYDMLVRESHRHTLMGNGIEIWRMPNGDPVAHYIESASHERLKLFVMSVFWRSHVSSRPELLKFDLGAHANKIHEMLVNGQGGRFDEFSVFIERNIESIGGSVMIAPWRSSIEGVKFVNFMAGGFHFMMKVDDRSLSEELAPLALGNANKVIIPLKRFRDTKLFKEVGKTVVAVNDRYGNPWGRSVGN